MRSINMDKSRILEIISMAWADEIPFHAIEEQLGVSEGAVIRIMRANLKPRSFELWRKRVTGRSAKNAQIEQIRPLGRKKSQRSTRSSWIVE
ncbi:MAG: TIGR03643 family protein [Pontiellaceae bacterium]